MDTAYIKGNMMKEDLLLIEEKHPLIHNITNYVAMNFVANCLLAIGASPIMARAPEEVGEISSCCDALALNLGILEKDSIKAMKIAGMAAKRNDIPTVLDVVGVGATSFRMKAAIEIISSCHPTVVKGNASEIQALYTHQVADVGIDSSIESKEIKEQAELLAKRLSCTVVVTGSSDIITDGIKTEYVSLGHPMMRKVTAMGCASTGIIAAFLSIDCNPFSASVHAMQAMGRAGERAAAISKGNGSMMINFLDELCNLSCHE